MDTIQRCNLRLSGFVGIERLAGAANAEPRVETKLLTPALGVWVLPSNLSLQVAPKPFPYSFFSPAAIMVLQRAPSLFFLQNRYWIVDN